MWALLHGMDCGLPCGRSCACKPSGMARLSLQAREDPWEMRHISTNPPSQIDKAGMLLFCFPSL